MAAVGAPQPFSAQAVFEPAESGGVAARTRQAVDEAGAERFMASCLAHMGRLKEAQEIVKRLRAITPVVIPSAEHWRIREDREYYLDGLRLAAGITRDEVASR